MYEKQPGFMQCIISEMKGNFVAARVELLSKIEFGLSRQILIRQFNEVLLIIKCPCNLLKRLHWHIILHLLNVYIWQSCANFYINNKWQK